jgi:hypothetical protein
MGDVMIHDDGNCYVPKCPSCGAPARFLEPVDGYIECWMCLIRWEADEDMLDANRVLQL